MIALDDHRVIAFGDFAVLVPTNNDFGSIESALAEAAIPYVTFAGTGFLNRQEIFDIENMLLHLPGDAGFQSTFYRIANEIIRTRPTSILQKNLSVGHIPARERLQPRSIQTPNWSFIHELDATPFATIIVHKFTTLRRERNQNGWVLRSTSDRNSARVSFRLRNAPSSGFSCATAGC